MKVYAFRHTDPKLHKLGFFGICPCVQYYEHLYSDKIITVPDYQNKWDLELITTKPFISSDKDWMERFLNKQVEFAGKTLHPSYAKDEIEIVELELGER